tara:strand:- start:1051 stop:1500 length:450 start_codon:yes stop_codon:yes gene_type:complete
MKDKVNEIKISYVDGIKSKDWIQISTSAQAAEVIFEHWDKRTMQLQETFKIVLLNNSNKVKGICQISQGGISGTLVDMRILFATVLKSLSVGIILAHNHPSGKLEPSKADISLTKKIKKAASVFDIRLLDHLIFAPDGDYYSFADNEII